MERPRYDHESQQEPLKALRDYRYSLDAIHRREVSSDDYPWREVIRYFESYVSSELGLSKADTGNVLKVVHTLRLIPHANTLDGEVCEAQERSYMAPLLFVGEFVEGRYFAEEKSYDDTLLWFKEAALVAMSGGMHSFDECLKGGDDSDEACNDSLHCPLRIVRYFFTIHAMEHTTEQMIDPKRSAVLTRGYLGAALELNLIEKTEYNALLSVHEQNRQEESGP